MKLSEKVIEHFQNPRNVGVIEESEGMGTMINPVCGDVTEIYLRIRNGIIEDAKFKSLGCAVTIASASIFTEKIKGISISKLFELEDTAIIKKLIGFIEDELGELPKEKLHCPPGTVHAFLDGLLKHMQKKGESNYAERIKELMPKIYEYYKRGKKHEGDGN